MIALFSKLVPDNILTCWFLNVCTNYWFIQVLEIVTFGSSFKREEETDEIHNIRNDGI